MNRNAPFLPSRKIVPGPVTPGPDQRAAPPNVKKVGTAVRRVASTIRSLVPRRLR